MKHVLVLACIALSACSSHTVTRDVPVTVKVPVSAPCLGTLPIKPPPLPDSSHWAQMDVRQKSAAVGAKAIQWRDYGEQMEAAAGACQ